ncbi:MAG: SH3 domain-containing protein [Pseudomonadota bacterium]
MRFILGVLSGVTFSLLLAVTYVVLNPLPNRQSAALAPQPDAPVQRASVIETASVGLKTAGLQIGLGAAAPETTAENVPNPELVAAGAALAEAVTEQAVTEALAAAQETPDGPTLTAPAAFAPLGMSALEPAGRPMLRPVAWLPAVSPEAPMPPVADTEPPSAIDLVYVTGRSVNMRSGPGARYDWLASLPRGTALILMDQQGRWSKVQASVDGAPVTGWMAASFLTPDPVDA